MLDQVAHLEQAFGGQCRPLCSRDFASASSVPTLPALSSFLVFRVSLRRVRGLARAIGRYRNLSGGPPLSTRATRALVGFPREAALRSANEGDIDSQRSVASF